MKAKKYITWVAVLDGRKALLLTKSTSNRLEILDHAFTAEPIRTNTETHNTLGRSFSSSRAGVRHIIEPHTDEQTQEKQEFIKEISEYLESSLWEYDRLILAAPPKALGYLRKILSKEVKDKVILELDNDFVRLAPHQIQQHLEKLIPIF